MSAFGKLQTILQKLGKSGPEELTPAGRATYEQYREFLTRAEKGITVQTLYDFKKAEKERIIGEIANPDVRLNSELDMFLKAELKICLIDLAMLESPQTGLKMLERELDRVIGVINSKQNIK